MIKGDRDTGGNGEELEKPCHWLFDLIDIQDPVVGGYSSWFGLQVDSIKNVPVSGTNIRPLHEGDLVQETYDLSNPKNPIPVRRIHTHVPAVELISSSGYVFATTITEPMSPKDADKFKKENPIIAD